MEGDNVPLIRKNRQQATSLLSALVLLIINFLLVACGGGSSDSVPSINDISVNSQNKFSGVVQKGPFSPESVVRVEQLSKKNKPTNRVIETKTSGPEASYSYAIPDNWKIDNKDPGIELTATGRFLDESIGSISGEIITLRALLSKPTDTSINLLTEWVSARAKVLMLLSHLSLSESLKLATTELQVVSGIKRADQLDISQNKDNGGDSAQLLLLSGALLDVSIDYTVSAQLVLNQIAADFADNGKLDDQGKVWFKRIQGKIRNQPEYFSNKYASILNKHLGHLTAPSGKLLPERLTIAAKPQAIAPEVIFAQPGEIVILDGSASHDSGNIINSTWFRIDQQEQFVVPLNDRFSDSPTIVAPNQESELLFALIVTDEDKLTDTTVVKVIVRLPEEVNESPVANSQAVVTLEDTPIDIVITGSDPESDTLTFDVGNTPLLLRHGILEGDAPDLKYTPEPNYFGEDSFAFTVSDDLHTSEKAIVDITILPINDEPVADPQSVTTNENTSKSITLTGSDIENDPLTFSILSPTSNGSLDTSALPEVIYTPNTNFTGSDIFTFEANDGVDSSDPAQVNITVLPINGKPLAFTQSVETPQETPINIFLSGRDIDGDEFTYTILINPNNGVLTGRAPNLTYHPNFGYVGLDSFIFKVNDGQSDSNNSVVSIRVTPIINNSVPTANPVTVTTDVNTPIAITLMGSDPDGDTLTYILFSNPGQGTLTGIVPNLNYQPNTDFIGTDLFFYAVNDGKAFSSLALVDITITSVANNPPIANAGSDLSLVVNPDGSNSNTTQIVTLTGSGTDTDGTIQTYKWTQLSGATTSLSDNGIAAPSLTTPAIAMDTTEVLVYQLVVTDDQGAESAPDEVMVTINLNEAPVANAGVDQTVDQNVVVTLDGSGTDTEDGSNVNYQWIASPGISLSDTSIPNPTFIAPLVSTSIPETYIFSLVVTDTLDLSSVADTVAITVTPPGNLPPEARILGPVSVFVNETIKVDGSGSFDTDGTIESYEWTTSTGDSDSGSTVSFIAPSTPGDLTIELTVEDDDGSIDTATILIEVKALVNQPPVATPLTLDTNENMAVTVPLFGTDPDAVDTVTVVDSSISTPANGAVTQAGGVYTYAPALGFSGTDSFTYQVTDGSLTSTAATVTINVNGKPTANAGVDQIVPSFRVSTSAGGTFTNVFTLDGLRSNDPEDTNGSIDSTEILKYEWTYIGGTGTGNLANSDISKVQKPKIAISSTGEVSGTYIFQLSVIDTDGLKSENIAQVTITVDPPNSPPIASNISRVNDSNDPVVIDLRNFASDPDGDPLDFEIINEASINVPFDLNLSTLPIITASNPADRPVSGSFQYRVKDIPHGEVSNNATISISFNPINNLPVAVIKQGSSGGTAINKPFDLSGEGSFDDDLDPLTYQWTVVQIPPLNPPATPPLFFGFEPPGTEAQAVTRFRANAIGFYEITLTVSDGKDTSSELIIIEVF